MDSFDVEDIFKTLLGIQRHIDRIETSLYLLIQKIEEYNIEKKRMEETVKCLDTIIEKVEEHKKR